MYLVEEIKQKQRLSGFNSIFAVASVEAARAYYEEFRRQMAADPTKALRVAVIYSYAPNEELTDGLLDEENPDVIELMWLDDAGDSEMTYVYERVYSAE